VTRSPVLAALGCILCVSSVVRAELPAIDWLHEREAAFAKAGTEARPLFIFFAEVNKGARLIEMSVFDDDRVKAALKDFVCLRIDPFEHKGLAEKFNLQIAFAVGAMSVDGEAMAFSEGEFRSDEVVNTAHEALKKFGPIPTAAEIARLAASIARAERALAAKDYARASQEAQKVIRSGVRSAHQKRAREIRAEIDAAAAAALKAAMAKEAASPAGARSLYESIKNDFGGTAVAAEAAARLDALVESGVVDFRAVENAAYLAYRKALRFEKLERFADAAAAYREVTAGPTTQYTGMAQAALERLENNPAVMKAIENARDEKEAAAMYRQAEMWAANEAFAKAEGVLRRLTAEYPETSAAAKAWDMLRRLPLR